MSTTPCTQCGDLNTISIKGSFVSDGTKMPSGKPTETGWIRRECCWCGYKFNQRVEEQTDG